MITVAKVMVAVKRIGCDQMKIEKINDNQIRCTLTKEDLELHQIQLGELAYGSEKAKKLFRDMMEQAQMQFGFEADNIPLMIEAIPISSGSIILIITKVDDPEVLDTRFSKFTPFKDQGQRETLEVDGADNMIDMFQKVLEAKLKNLTKKVNDSVKEIDGNKEETPSVNLIRLFTFSTLDHVISAAHGLNGFFTGENTLYKDHNTGSYFLVLHQSGISPEDFNRVCNILSEYGKNKAFSPAGEAYLREHGDLISKNALQQLIQL